MTCQKKTATSVHQWLGAANDTQQQQNPEASLKKKQKLSDASAGSTCTGTAGGSQGGSKGGQENTESRVELYRVALDLYPLLLELRRQEVVGRRRVKRKVQGIREVSLEDLQRGNSSIGNSSIVGSDSSNVGGGGVVVGGGGSMSRMGGGSMSRMGGAMSRMGNSSSSSSSNSSPSKASATGNKGAKGGANNKVRANPGHSGAGSTTASSGGEFLCLYVEWSDFHPRACTIQRHSLVLQPSCQATVF